MPRRSPAHLCRRALTGQRGCLRATEPSDANLDLCPFLVDLGNEVVGNRGEVAQGHIRRLVIASICRTTTPRSIGTAMYSASSTHRRRPRAARPAMKPKPTRARQIGACE